MKFGRFPVADCRGAVLAHSVRLESGYLSKGRSLSDADILSLRKAGVEEIMAAFLESGDVAENDAVGRIAALLTGPGIKAGEAKTGRVNLYACGAGLLKIDAPALLSLNALDEGISIATLAGGTPVEPDRLVGTVKVVPFALAGECLAAAEQAAGDALPVAIIPYRAAEAGLVLTRLNGTRGSILAKARRTVEQRLARLGSRLQRHETVTHHEEHIARAITRQARAGCSPILILGASATLDRQDVVPEGISRAGGTVTRFGMPVDPGNLLVLGRLGDIPLIGLPGCARSLNRNGFDWVLERVLAGLEPSPEDIAGLGAGGLLKEIPGRPQPREAGLTDDAGGAGSVWAIVLAAGQSKRMGRQNKLLSPVRGKPMVARVVSMLKGCALDGILVTLGHQAAKVQDVLPRKGVRMVTNKSYRQGLGSSIRCAVGALDEEVDAALIVLADMPIVQPLTIASLLGALRPAAGRSIAVPRYRGKRGNPVLFARRHFAALSRLEDDAGARRLLVEHADAVIEVAVDDPGVLVDVDTQQMLEQLEAGFGKED